MDNVVQFPGLTLLDLDAATILNNIAGLKPQNVFVITWDDEGGVSYHSNLADTKEVVSECQQFIHSYYNGDFSE